MRTVKRLVPKPAKLRLGHWLKTPGTARLHNNWYRQPALLTPEWRYYLRPGTSLRRIVRREP